MPDATKVIVEGSNINEEESLIMEADENEEVSSSEVAVDTDTVVNLDSTAEEDLLKDEDVVEKQLVEEEVVQEDDKEQESGDNQVTSSGVGDDEVNAGKVSRSSDTTVAVAVSEGEEEDDDVILLDDDDEEEELEESGVSDSKKARKEDEDNEALAVATMKEEDKLEVVKQLQRLSRTDMEDLILAKVVEAAVAHTEAGKLRAKVIELTRQKDKMTSKMGIIMKQVVELSTALNNIIDNEERSNPLRNRISGKPHIIRFNRSVGLQTYIEPSVRSAPPRIVKVPIAAPPERSAAAPHFSLAGGGSRKKPAPSHPVPQNRKNVVIAPPPPPPSQPVKRTYQGGNKTGNENKNINNKAIKTGTQQVTITSTTPKPISPRKVYNPSVAPPKLVPIAPSPALAGIVDLTDDEIQVNTQSGIQGIQYQMINNGTPQRVQVISAGPGQQYIVRAQPPQQQQQQAVQQVYIQQQQNQQLTFRNVAIPTTQQQQQQPQRTYPVGALTDVNSNGNQQRQRVIATVPSGGVATAAAGAGNNKVRRQIILPPLPPTPPNKVRNDSLMPPGRPDLTLKEQSDGIVLSWNLIPGTNSAEVTTYQIYASQEDQHDHTKVPSPWKKIGDVKALPLPMACTLSQFTEENKYYFIIRGIDQFGRVGPFCHPQSILLRLKRS